MPRPATGHDAEGQPGPGGRCRVSERNDPVPRAHGETGPKKFATARKLNLTSQSTGSGDKTTPATLAALGEKLRDEGIARANDALDAWTRSCWQTAINYYASIGQPFGADECRELGVPEPASPGAIGALFMANSRAGTIRPAGFVQSRRPSRRASWQRQWIGGDAGE
jgi:hypothetical protein